jgi:hypothetical protein
MFGSSSIDMKRKVLEEILADIDDKEGMKLKPKESVMGSSGDMEEMNDNDVKGDVVDNGKGGMPEPDNDDEMSDDDLKKLLKSYVG